MTTRLKQWSYPRVESLGLSHLFPCRTLSRTSVLHLIAIWPLKPMSPIWYAQLTLNSVALVPSVIFCPLMPQRLLSLPLFFHVLIIATFFLFFFVAVLSISTDHISPHLASLHWLHIDSQIQYKLSSLCYNCLNSTAPDYLTELKIYKPTHQLRSSSDTSILFSHCMHTLAWSKVIFLCCTGSLEHSPLRNQVIQHHLIHQIIT